MVDVIGESHAGARRHRKDFVLDVGEKTQLTAGSAALTSLAKSKTAFWS